MTIPVLESHPDSPPSGATQLALHIEENQSDLPVYGGPNPKDLEEAYALMADVGIRYRELSEDVNIAILALEAATLAADQGAEPEQVHLPDQPTEEGVASAADSLAPVEAMSSASDACPAPDPVPEPAVEGIPIPLWADVAMKIYPETRSTYPVEFTKGDVRLFLEAPRSPPWLSTRIQDRLIARLMTLMTSLGDDGRPRDFVRRKVTEAFAAIAKQLETDDGAKKALTSAAVRTVIKRTGKVTVYPGNEGGFYEIVISGKVLTISTAQMAKRTANGDGAFNHLWLNLFPTDEIDASPADWRAIKRYFFEIAEIREVEQVTEVEIILERLREDLETITLVATPEQVVGDGTAWRDPATNEVWVPARRITRFLTETVNNPGWSSRLSKEVRGVGGMKKTTQTKDIGNPLRKTRCWVFAPGFAVFRDCSEGCGTVAEYLERGMEANR